MSHVVQKMSSDKQSWERYLKIGTNIPQTVLKFLNLIYFF